MTWGPNIDRPLRENFCLQEPTVTQPVSSRTRILTHSIALPAGFPITKPMGMEGLTNLSLYLVYTSWMYLRLLRPKVLTSTFPPSILPPSLSVWG